MKKSLSLFASTAVLALIAISPAAALKTSVQLSASLVRPTVTDGIPGSKTPSGLTDGIPGSKTPSGLTDGIPGSKTPSGLTDGIPGSKTPSGLTGTTGSSLL